MNDRPIPTDVLTVLSRCTTEGNILRLPPEQLDRKLYVGVNKVLEALGGKWTRKVKGHVFQEDPAERLEDCLLTGTYARPEDFGYFPSPPAVAAQVAELAELKPGQRVLEPSAGTGALVGACLQRHSTLQFECVELQPDLADGLQKKFPQCKVVKGDFLTLKPMVLGVRTSFDRVVMNPPFSKGQDVEHVLHALKFLRPGGLLVSVMSAGVTFRQDRRYVDFRHDVDVNIDPLPEGSFKPSGTNVNAVIVRIRA